MLALCSGVLRGAAHGGPERRRAQVGTPQAQGRHDRLRQRDGRRAVDLSWQLAHRIGEWPHSQLAGHLAQGGVHERQLAPVEPLLEPRGVHHNQLRCGSQPPGVVGDRQLLELQQLQRASTALGAASAAARRLVGELGGEARELERPLEKPTWEWLAAALGLQLRQPCRHLLERGRGPHTDGGQQGRRPKEAVGGDRRGAEAERRCVTLQVEEELRRLDERRPPPVARTTALPRPRAQQDRRVTNGAAHRRPTAPLNGPQPHCIVARA